MRPIVFPVTVALCTSAFGCLPNPQSEWVTSEGGEQRSTLTDATFEKPDCDVVLVLDDDDWLPATTAHVHVAHAHVAHHHRSAVTARHR